MTGQDASTGGPDREFPVTSWTEVRAAADPGNPRSREFLSRLCQRYWRPICEYFRSLGRLSPDEAKDLTQDFFARLLEKEHLARMDPGRGSFRGFLKRSIQNYLLDWRRREAARRPTGEARLVPLGASPELAGEDEASDAFDRDWARALLEAALAELEARLKSSGLAHYHEVFRLHSLHEEGGERPSYRQIAHRLGTSEAVVRKRLARCRRELREIVMKLIQEYAADAEEARAEFERFAGL
ncbi:MAG: RNA polymerase sigma factor [Planctomycetes bacterium]|nr:RNA polymerase sigma factor [Planctomycetota bacterium]